MGNSLKKSMIMGFSLLPTIDALKGNKLVLLTPAGVVTGILEEEDAEDMKTASGLIKSTVSTVEDNYFKESTVENNDGFMLLRQVTLMIGNNTFNFESFVVFFDQIIGVSIAAVN